MLMIQATSNQDNELYSERIHFSLKVYDNVLNKVLFLKYESIESKHIGY